MNVYPLWRYILLAVLIILGIIYALPNLYGEEPAIQVQPKGTTVLNADLDRQITEILKSQAIRYRSIKREGFSDVIRFYDTADQLKAQDLIQANLGPNYAVALFLADKTPNWLKKIGAKPMRLGLDLRGGIHFLLQVDTVAMIKEQQNNDMRNMASLLREQQIRYTGFNQTPKGEIQIQFRDAASLNTGLATLKKQYPDYEFTVPTGGLALTGVLSKNAEKKMVDYSVSQNITILNNRINELGVAEPVIQQQGQDQISVDLPGLQDTARAKAMIGTVATIFLQLQDLEHNAETAAKTGIIPPGSNLYMYENRPILLKSDIVLHGSSILSANSTTDENGRPAVTIRAGGSEVSAFNRITRENVGKPLATVYVETQSVKKIVNGQVAITHQQVAHIINIANINTALGAQFQITGLSSTREAQDLALQLRSGAYVAPVAFVQERLLGPSLGKKNISQGINSMVVAISIVVIFMLIYYRLFGLIADFALVLNTIFIIAVMSLLGATLTLPGIAGMVLTVGMAVDANVLINERIREELRHGMSPQASIYTGYERAFSTILDSNVTTLIVAVILFTLGTGSVQSFAITLTIGILSSMVTAIFFTRAWVNLIYGGRSTVKKLSIGIRHGIF